MIDPAILLNASGNSRDRGAAPFSFVAPPWYCGAAHLWDSAVLHVAVAAAQITSSLNG